MSLCPKLCSYTIWNANREPSWGSADLPQCSLFGFYPLGPLFSVASIFWPCSPYCIIRSSLKMICDVSFCLKLLFSCLYQVSSINFISIKHYIKIHQDKKRHIYNKIIWRSRLESQWGMIIAYPLLRKQHT